MTRKLHRMFIAEAKKLGAEYESLKTTGGSHLWLTLTFQGNRRAFLIANSPSDRRAFLNWKSDVRKWMKGHDTGTSQGG